MWFKCSILSLRSQDITFINSQVKSWLYQDCLEKPSELVLYRKPEEGGLGLFNVKIRALALLIRTFLETSANPTFRHSLYHETLYRYHVLGEVSLPDPGLPPFYSEDFFKTIQHYHVNSPMNIARMSTKEWYRVLLEDQLLMSQPTENNPAQLLPTRVETLSPENDWPEIWRLARISGLSSQLTSFLFKLLHGLLPTQDRVDDGDQPGHYQHCHDEVEDPLHALFFCHLSQVAGLGLLGYAQKTVPNLSPEAAIKLDIGAALSDKEELATVCLLATGWMYIWEARSQKKRVTLYKMRAEVEAMITILRKSRHREVGELMLGMIN